MSQRGKILPMRFTPLIFVRLLLEVQDGYFLMLPKEFDAILALEHKAVSQVVLEVLRQTIGRVGDGQNGRQEWATMSYRHFARAGILSQSQAQEGIKQALAKGYIVRRQRGRVST
jgi:hypothetical protein